MNPFARRIWEKRNRLLSRQKPNNYRKAASSPRPYSFKTKRITPAASVKADEFPGCFFCTFPYFEYNKTNVEFILKTEH